MSKLVRTLAGYAECSADAIASGSKAQMMFFVADAEARLMKLNALLGFKIERVSEPAVADQAEVA